jgi:hypothetical protein
VPPNNAKTDEFRKLSPLIHVGYAKTGSTWLQRSVFSKADLGFLSVPLLEVLENFVFTDIADGEVEKVFHNLGSHLERAAAEGLVLVLSHEVLVGDQTQGRYWGRLVGKRLHTVFPRGKVLMVLREQRSMLVSSYRQHIRVGGHSSLSQFMNREPGFDAYCRPEFLEYDHMITYYQEQFGKDQVLALPYELMRSDLPDFYRRVLEFAGVGSDSSPDETVYNPGFGAGTLEIRRHMNRLLGGWTYYDGPRRPRLWALGDWSCHKLQRILPGRYQGAKEAAIRSMAAEMVEGRYVDSNRRTSQLIGIDLTRFGYQG